MRLKRIVNMDEIEDVDIFKRRLVDENSFNCRGCSSKPSLDTPAKQRYDEMGCCAQMHTYEWTKEFDNLSSTSTFNIVEVRFKNTHKDFFRISNNVEDFQTGDIVAVESTSGHNIGIISLKGELVRLQLKKKGLDENSLDIKNIYRKAAQLDVDKWIEAINKEKEIQRRARILAIDLNLSMKIINVEFQGDGTKAIFYYTAEERVDFRQLIRSYAEEFKIRIEMRQIGARQEAGNLGGIGACGREFCCVSFLHNFVSVSTHSARVQQVSLNPNKLAGQCSKLKCCLNYEYEVYEDALKNFPDTRSVLKTKKGDAKCVKIDTLHSKMYYVYENEPNRFIELSISEAKEIIDLNKKGELVDEIAKRIAKSEVTQEDMEYTNVVGQDDLTRFDNKKSNNKRRNRKGNKSQRVIGAPKNKDRNV